MVNEASVNHPRILVVDDDDDATSILVELLVHSGRLARVARDGVEALSAAAQMQPDVVLLDICLPRLDGCETARLLRGDPRFARTRLIAFTGRSTGQWTRLFDAHLSKPCTFDEVEQALGLAGLAR